MNERNKRIVKSMENGEVPVLPFEIKIAQAALARLKDQQKDLAVKLRAAMEQSSETWHDNPAADIISDDSKLVTNAAERNLRIVYKRAEFGYENDDDTRVTLGSLVDVHYGNDPEISQLFITGTTREIPPELLDIDAVNNIDEVECVTLGSPVGEALFDKQVGETTSFEVSGRTITLEVVAVHQVKG